MKDFNSFISEAVKIVGFRKFKNPPKTYISGLNKISYNDDQLREVNIAIARLNKIASKYGAYFDDVAIKGHLMKRLRERKFSINDIINTFQKAAKNTTYFDDLKENSNILINGKGPQVIYRAAKQHIGTIIKRNGTKIIVKSIMGDFRQKYIMDLKQNGIPVYFVK